MPCRTTAGQTDRYLGLPVCRECDYRFDETAEKQCEGVTVTQLINAAARYDLGMVKLSA